MGRWTIAMSDDGDGANAFDVATANDQCVNEMLADTDGSVCTMEYTGAIGYHIHVASGESDPEYLWKIALLQALDDALFGEIHVDEANPSDARDQLERQIEGRLDPFTADFIANEFESNLTDLITVQEERAIDHEVDRDE